VKTRINEDVKLDVGIQAQSLNGAATGRYFSMAGYGKALAILTAGAIAATKTTMSPPGDRRRWLATSSAAA